MSYSIQKHYCSHCKQKTDHEAEKDKGKTYLVCTNCDKETTK